MRTAEEIEQEEQEDERTTGCALQGLGCAADGCLNALLPFAFVFVFVWLLS